MRTAGGFHLTYCSNIHAGESWTDVRRNLAASMPSVRRALAFDGPMAIGLRLSAAAAEALERPLAMAEFRRFLADGGYYVFTINGFPYGAFHATRVKESVYLPDWRDERRLAYSDRLARILAALLPDEGIEGSVSTVPVGYKPPFRVAQDADDATRNLLRHVATLAAIRAETGRTIALALEPEPCCVLEDIDETVSFFERLCDPVALDARTASIDARLDPADVRRHLGVCYDACHMAVEFEEPEPSLARLERAGIRVLKVQVSSALRLVLDGVRDPAVALAPFTDDIYLHQVVERTGHALTRYADLPEALAVDARRRATALPQAREWRVHFHVPIFLESLPGLGTTQAHLVTLFEVLRRRMACSYLEVETYTWDVLPPGVRTISVTDAIARELQWVRSHLEQSLA